MKQNLVALSAETHPDFKFTLNETLKILNLSLNSSEQLAELWGTWVWAPGALTGTSGQKSAHEQLF